MIWLSYAGLDQHLSYIKRQVPIWIHKEAGDPSSDVFNDHNDQTISIQQDNYRNYTRRYSSAIILHNYHDVCITCNP